MSEGCSFQPQFRVIVLLFALNNIKTRRDALIVLPYCISIEHFMDLLC
jgi:hypothetical protein